MEVIFNFSAEIGVFELTFRVTLRFEDTAVKKKIFLTCICARNFLINFALSTFHQCEFLTFKYFHEYTYGVQERAKNALSHILYAFLSIYLTLKTSHRSQVLDETIWDFFLEHIHVFLKIIFCNIKVFKLQRYSSVTLPQYRRTPKAAEKLIITSTKIEILPQKIFTEWFGKKEMETIRFWKYFIINHHKLMFPKKCVFWSQKGSIIWTLF